MTKPIPANAVQAKAPQSKTVQAVRVGLLAAPQESLSGNWLYLTVTRGDVRSGDTRGTLLLCDPPQGHPHAAQFCEELRAVKGDISRIPPRADVLCPLVYAPVTASAQGVWDGRRVTYTHTFSNSCVMGAETGAAFGLSD
ncbi:SSI family serine proteinase inhibitor [Streptomyces sp. NPDC001530]|uniref:SSI family serine proteinase inhibitor n=1 Tax=Streptomyces sp. NPDC001530 TaxID=3364582 RepID=UPI00367C3E4F